MTWASRYFAPRYFAPRYFGTKRPASPGGGLPAGAIIPFPVPQRWRYLAAGGLRWGGTADVGYSAAVSAHGGLHWGGTAALRWLPDRYELARQEEEEAWLLML